MVLRYCLVLQVQRLVLGSFLGRQWEQQQSQNLLEVREREHPATQLGSVPPVFVLQVLLPAAGQVRKHERRREADSQGARHRQCVGCRGGCALDENSQKSLSTSKAVHSFPSIMGFLRLYCTCLEIQLAIHPGMAVWPLNSLEEGFSFRVLSLCGP